MTATLLDEIKLEALKLLRDDDGVNSEALFQINQRRGRYLEDSRFLVYRRDDPHFPLHSELESNLTPEGIIPDDSELDRLLNHVAYLTNIFKVDPERCEINASSFVNRRLQAGS